MIDDLNTMASRVAKLIITRLPANLQGAYDPTHNLILMSDRLKRYVEHTVCPTLGGPTV